MSDASKHFFVAGFRSFLGDGSQHNTLELMNDADGNLYLVIQEKTDIFKMRSCAVRIERGMGDSAHHEIHQHFEKLIELIKANNRKNPQNPSFVVTQP